MGNIFTNKTPHNDVNSATSCMINMLKEENDNRELFKDLIEQIPNFRSYSFSDYPNESGFIPITLAAKYGCSRIVEMLLNEKYFEVNQRDNRCTSLHHACANNRSTVATCMHLATSIIFIY